MGGRGKSRAHNPNLESRPRPRAGRLECVVWRQQAKSGTVAGPRPRATDQWRNPCRQCRSAHRPPPPPAPRSTVL